MATNTTGLEFMDRMTDLARFLASDPVARARTGQSPHQVIHRQNKASLRYFPARGEARLPALFISMPLINTWTVFDLLPGRSVVEALTTAGAPVYLLDWGRPGPEDAELRLAELVDDLLPRALDRASRHQRAQGADGGLQALGYCVGGTFLALRLAHDPGPVQRMSLLCAPIDFHASGRLALWARPETFPLDELVDGLGNFPPSLMRESFRLLRPQGQLSKWKGLYERVEDDDFRALWAAMEQWSEDGVDFPGEAYREYVRRCYFDNALMRGGWTLGSRPVDLGRARIPALAIAADADHICPPAAAHALTSAWGAPSTALTLKGGHVGVCVGKALPKALLGWLGERAA